VWGVWGVWGDRIGLVLTSRRSIYLAGRFQAMLIDRYLFIFPI
jgi:hypothetical protein